MLVRGIGLWRGAILTALLLCSATCTSPRVIIVSLDDRPVFVEAGYVVPSSQDGWVLISPSLMSKMYSELRKCGLILEERNNHE